MKHKKNRELPEYQKREKQCHKDDELLNLDELMDVQGGTETDVTKGCGLGCFLTGIQENGTNNGSGNEGQS